MITLLLFMCIAFLFVVMSIVNEDEETFIIGLIMMTVVLIWGIIKRICGGF